MKITPPIENPIPLTNVLEKSVKSTVHVMERGWSDAEVKPRVVG